MSLGGRTIVTVHVLEVLSAACEAGAGMKTLQQSRAGTIMAARAIVRTEANSARLGKLRSILMIHQSSKRTTKVVNLSEECNCPASWRAASSVLKRPTRTR